MCLSVCLCSEEDSDLISSTIDIKFGRNIVVARVKARIGERHGSASPYDGTFF